MAGKQYHNTEDWTDSSNLNVCELIQIIADRSAKQIKEAKNENTTDIV
jgi:hypothetical protein